MPSSAATASAPSPFMGRMIGSRAMPSAALERHPATPCTALRGIKATATRQRNRHSAS